MINPNELRLKVSQLSISDLESVKTVGNNQYDLMMSSEKDPEDLTGLTNERETFNSILNDVISNKFFDLIEVER